MIKKFLNEFARWNDHRSRIFSGIPVEKTSKITKDIYVGGQYGRKALEYFEEWGIGGIVSLRRSLPPEFIKTPKLAVLHIPVKEHHPPSIETLQAGIEFITAQIKKGKKVYIHCHWGEGRGPSMAIAYLMTLGHSLEESLEMVKKVRFFIRLTPSQLTRLMEFEKSL